MFPYKDQIEELLFVMVSFCIFQTRNICLFLINFNVLTATFFQSMIWPVFAESAIKFQSGNQYRNKFWQLDSELSVMSHL